MGNCPQRISPTYDETSLENAGIIIANESVVPVSSNLFFEQDMTDGLEFPRLEEAQIEHEDSDISLIDGNLAASKQYENSDSSEQLLMAEIDYEEAVYDEAGNVIDVIQHFKKTNSEIRQEKIAEIARRRQILQESSKKYSSKLPTPESSSSAFGDGRITFDIYIPPFCSNSNELYVLLGNSALRQLLEQLDGGIFNNFKSLVGSQIPCSDLFKSQDSLLFLINIIDEMLIESPLAAQISLETPQIITKEHRYEVFYNSVNATLLHRHFSVVCIEEWKCGSCNECSYSFIRYILILVNQDFYLKDPFACFLGQTRNSECQTCGGTTIGRVSLWSVGRQILVEFAEPVQVELPEYIVIYQYIHPEASICSERITLAAAAGQGKMWIRKRKSVFLVENGTAVECKQVEGVMYNCSYDVIQD